MDVLQASGSNQFKSLAIFRPIGQPLKRTAGKCGGFQSNIRCNLVCTGTSSVPTLIRLRRISRFLTFCLLISCYFIPSAGFTSWDRPRVFEYRHLHVLL